MEPRIDPRQNQPKPPDPIKKTEPEKPQKSTLKFEVGDLRVESPTQAKVDKKFASTQKEDDGKITKLKKEIAAGKYIPPNPADIQFLQQAAKESANSVAVENMKSKLRMLEFEYKQIPGYRLLKKSNARYRMQELIGQVQNYEPAFRNPNYKAPARKEKYVQQAKENYPVKPEVKVTLEKAGQKRRPPAVHVEQPRRVSPKFGEAKQLDPEQLKKTLLEYNQIRDELATIPPPKTWLGKFFKSASKERRREQLREQEIELNRVSSGVAREQYLDPEQRKQTAGRIVGEAAEQASKEIPTELFPESYETIEEAVDDEHKMSGEDMPDQHERLRDEGIQRVEEVEGLEEEKEYPRAVRFSEGTESVPYSGTPGLREAPAPPKSGYTPEEIAAHKKAQAAAQEEVGEIDLDDPVDQEEQPPGEYRDSA